MIVDCAVYEHGRRRAADCSLPDAAGQMRDEGAFVWIGLLEPTAEELELVGATFGPEVAFVTAFLCGCVGAAVFYLLTRRLA